MTKNNIGIYFLDTSKNNGITALPLIILIGGIILTVAIAMVLVAFYFSESGAGSQYSAEALAISQAGINDAVIRIIRTPSFNPGPSNPYYLDFGSHRTAQVIVCQNLRTVTDYCDAWENNSYEITSLGTVFGKNRRLRASIMIDPNTGEIRIASLKEIPL